MTWPWTCLKMIRRNRYPTAQLIFIVDHNMVYNISDQLTAALGGCNTCGSRTWGDSFQMMSSSARIATYCLPLPDIRKGPWLQFLLAHSQLPQHKVKAGCCRCSSDRAHWRVMEVKKKKRKKRMDDCESALQHEIKATANLIQSKFPLFIPDSSLKQA